MLLEAGADVNQVDCGGLTPLLNGAGPGNAEVVSALLESGADPFERRDHYPTSALARAAEYDKPGIVKVLLDAGVPVDDCDSDGATPLYTAAQAGAVEAARCLLDAGADPTKSCEGETPAETARRFGHEALAELIEMKVAHRRSPP